MASAFFLYGSFCRENLFEKRFPLHPFQKLLKNGTDENSSHRRGELCSPDSKGAFCKTPCCFCCSFRDPKRNDVPFDPRFARISTASVHVILSIAEPVGRCVASGSRTKSSVSLRSTQDDTKAAIRSLFSSFVCFCSPFYFPVSLHTIKHK